MKLNYFVFLFVFASFAGIHSFAQVTADFSADKTSGCAPFSVKFTDKSSPSDNVTWEWTLGNNNTSPLQNPIATYSTAGTYTVTLKATRNGQSSTKSMIIRVFKNPVANFSTINNITKGCVPFTARFEDLSVVGDTTIKSWLWTYDTGASSTLRQDDYIYSSVGYNNGKYSVVLKITDNHECQSTITKTDFIDVADRPQALFSPPLQKPCSVPVTIKFTNQSISKGTPSYSWISGNQASPLKEPSFTFSKYDTTYNIRLTVTDLDYQCTSFENEYNLLIPKLQAIGIIKQGAKTINKTGDVVCAGSVDLTSNSLPSNILPHWIFDNGVDSRFATTLNNYPFDNPGSHTVKLDISSDGCSDSIRWNFFVEKVIPQFNQNPNISCQSSASVSFTNTSSVNAASFLWKFSNGISSILKDPPAQTYTAPSDVNDYSVHDAVAFDTKLITSTINGCKDSVTNFFIIKRPTALFTVDTLSGCTNLKVTFTDKSLSDSAITARDWDFGDGNTSHQTTATTVQHIYTTDGIFNAKLTITNNNGCSDASYVIPIKIGKLATPSFSISPSAPVCQNDVITITDLTPASDKIDYWLYKINGMPIPVCSDVKNPSFIFKPGVGTLTITQTVSYNGCPTTSTTTKTITNNGPIADYTFNVDCASPYNYTFTNTSLTTAATTYAWDFGDGTSTAINPPHTYINAPANKDYTVKLIATTGTCKDTSIQTVYVRQKIAQFTTLLVTSVTTLISEGCAGMPVQFNSAASQPLNSICQDKYIWDFKDTTPLIRTALGLINHTFKYRGTYNVSLSAIHDNGCIDVASNPIRIYQPFSGLDPHESGGCPGVQLKFTDNSAKDYNNIIKFIMDYGDLNKPDTVNYTTGLSFIHKYPSAGLYYPYGKLIDSKGCVDSTVVFVGIEQPSVSLMTTEQPADQACANKIVTFIPDVQDMDNMNWDFGDGTTSNSNVLSINHVYTKEGIDTVKIKVSKYGCPASAEFVIKIQKADASFTVSDSAVSCNDTPISFTHKYPSTNIFSGEWETGDKKFPYDTAAHTITFFYKNPGTYTSQLSITTSFGCTDYKTKTIKVLSPGAKFDINPKQACIRDLITFTMHDTMNIGKFEWDFGDGNGDKTGLHPTTTYRYLAVGKKYVYLNIDNKSASCPKSLKDSITLDGAFAKFSVKDTAGCDKEPVVFTNLSTGQTEQLWNFSDGPVTAEVSPQHLFMIGTYPITLVVNNAAGCRDTAKRTLTIKKTPGITVSMTSCSNKVAHLHATGGNYVNWYPKQGLDDSTSYDPIATPVGSLYYKARVTNIDGKCTKTDSILIIRPQASFSATEHLSHLDTSMFVGTSLPIQVYDTSSVKSFYWDPATYLSCTDCLNPIAKPTESISYYLILTEPSKCFTDSLKVNILLKFGDLKFSAPNAFKPDDAANGLFRIYSQAYMELIEFKIYNRWGNVVFSSTQGMDTNAQLGFISKEGWDGKYQGKDQPIDTYIWVASARMFSKEGAVIVKNKGTLILVR